MDITSIRCITLVVAILSISSCLAEQVKICPTNQHQLDWSGGGAYPKILSHNDKVYLISDVSGIWNAGYAEAEWQQTNSGLANLSVSNIVFSTSQPLIGYATTKSGISKTIDGGETWQDLNNLPDNVNFKRWETFNNIAIDESIPTEFIFGDRKGNIYRYESEHAQLLITTPLEEVISSLIVSNQGTIVAGTSTSRYIFRQLDDQWQLTKQHPSTTLDLTVAGLNDQQSLFATSNNQVLISVDDGVHWESLNLEAHISDTSVAHRLAVKSNSLGEFSLIVAWYEDWKSGILVSHDSGKTWQNSLKEIDYSNTNPTRSWNHNDISKIMSVNFDYKDENILYFTTYWGIWRSTDAGETWTENFKTGASNTVGSGIAITENGDVVTASMDVGLIRYPTNGQPTSLLPIATDQYFDNDMAGHFWNVIVQSKKIIATSSAWQSEANQIVISEDSGVTWQRVSQGLPSYYSTDWPIWSKGYARALIADKNDPNKFFLGIDGHGLYISTNGGYEWQRSLTKPPSKRIYNALDQDKLNNILYWGTASNGVYSTNNDGETWVHTGLKKKYVYDLVVSQDGAVYAGSANSEQDGHGAAVFKKQNSESEWELVKDFNVVGAVDAMVVDPLNPERIVVSLTNWIHKNEGELHISNDAGINWQKINANVGIGIADLVFSTCSQQLFVAGYSQGISQIDISDYSAIQDLNVNINNFYKLQDSWAWSYYEDEQARSVWKSDAAISWKVTVENTKDIAINFESINKPGERKLPDNYPGFIIEVIVNGESKAQLTVPASDTEWQQSSILIPIDTTGEKIIELKWLNNISSPATDTNWGLRKISMSQ